jgi:serine/threonine-protein kinase
LLELAVSYMTLRRYPEAEQVLKQAVAIDPTSMISVNSLAYAYALQGELDRGTAVLDAAPTSLQSNSLILMSRATNLSYGRHYASARQLLAELKPDSGITAADIERLRGDVEWAAGDQAAARPYYLHAASLLEAALKQNASDSHTQPGDLGWVYARLGRTDDALKQGQLGITLHTMDKDVVDAIRALWNMARIQAQVGQVDEAIAGLDHLLSIPAGNNVSVPFLRLDTDWDPIRQDPRFQALLKKYDTAPPAPSATARD